MPLYLVTKEYADEHTLMHHRTRGSKNGIRRWQNKDGSYTPEGYKHYSEMYGWGTRKANAKEQDSESASLARTIYNNASKREPAITKDVVTVVQKSGGKMYGLDHRLKTEESISRKIDKNAKEGGIDKTVAANNIKDSIRYTSLSDDNNFVESYRQTKKLLLSKGYTEIKCRNYFELYRQGNAKHKQITSVFADDKGNRFELQFHTPSSIKAKEMKTPIYEEARKIGTTQKRKNELERQMEELAEKVTDPKDIFTIKSHG